MKISALNDIFYRVSLLDILFFTKHLSVMIKSGIPLPEAITTIKEQTQNIALKKILTDVSADIDNGQTIEKALSRHRSTFGSLYISLIGIGEKSGNLEENLEYLSLQLKKKYEFSKKIQAATLYPSIILITAVVIGGGISIFVLPHLVDLFKSLNVHLPLTTRILLFIADAFKRFGILILLALAGAFVGFKYLISLPSVKPKWHLFLLSAPLIGPFNQNVQLAYMCRDLGIMLKSGIPLSTALEVGGESTENIVFKDYIRDLKISSDKGKSLEDQLSTGKYKFIPLLVARMIGVGEATGKLEDSLLYLGDFFEEAVDDATKNLSGTLEPILLVIISLIVAFVALAIISPIYEFTGSINK